MMWAVVFVVCMPDALRGPQCDYAVVSGFSGFTTCEVNRPFTRRMVSQRLIADGLGAASINSGSCVTEPEAQLLFDELL